jgi:hypothetical protein
VADASGSRRNCGIRVKGRPDSPDVSAAMFGAVTIPARQSPVVDRAVAGEGAAAAVVDVACRGLEAG